MAIVVIVWLLRQLVGHVDASENSKDMHRVTDSLELNSRGFESLMDDDLQAAIAASLQAESAPLQQHNGVVDLTVDSDERLSSRAMKNRHDPEVANELALQKAIQLSMEHQESLLQRKSSPIDERGMTPKSTTGGAQLNGLSGIDRKKQEEERLARRANKRKREEITPTQPPEQLHHKQPRIERMETQKLEPKACPLPQAERALASRYLNVSIDYPNGVVKKTWAQQYDRKNDIKIEEVLQASDLQLAVLSSFQWDMGWLFSKFDSSKNTRLLLIMGAKDEEMKRQLLDDAASMPRVRLCFPSMEGEIYCMHSKLMLLFYPNSLRIVIPSANLVPYDWGEQGGCLENIMFLIDLPRNSESRDEGDKMTGFQAELVYFLQASKLDQAIIDKMLQFNFSNTANFALVHSIGGSHTGPSYKRTGHCGLGRAVSKLGLKVSRPLKLDYVTSSIGSLTSQFLRGMYFAAQGDNGLREYGLRNSKMPPNASTEEWKDRINVYFPTLKTVQESKGGVNKAGTIAFQSKWYYSGSFPRHIMRNNRSVRDGLLMHNKILFVRPEDGPILRTDGSMCRGWAYVGSANLSESAWGRLVRERRTKEPKLNCRNWECGVLFPILAPNEDTPEIEISSNGKSTVPTNLGEALTDVFAETIPVPMHVPGEKYGANDKPWFYAEDQ
ncbi:hypothetical protein FQN57_006395 [Myotisia sp. PD_48]|nr:hypothetical protein FQN57_006395 [Myotisia sp. PD_48]